MRIQRHREVKKKHYVDNRKNKKDDRKEGKLIETCVYIASHLNYSIEDILDHDIDWINAMINEISRQEFEKNIFELRLHGVKESDIEKIQHAYDVDTGKIKDKNIHVPSIAQLQSMGLSVGKPSKTRFKR